MSAYMTFEEFFDELGLSQEQRDTIMKSANSKKVILAKEVGPKWGNHGWGNAPQEEERSISRHPWSYDKGFERHFLFKKCYRAKLARIFEIEIKDEEDWLLGATND